MKKIAFSKTKIIIVIVLTVTLLLFCVACKQKDNSDSSNPPSPNPPQHTHEFTKKNTDEKFIHTQPTCYDSAIYFLSCACGEKSDQTFQYGNPLGHDLKDHVCIRCEIYYRRI